MAACQSGGGPRVHRRLNIDLSFGGAWHRVHGAFSLDAVRHRTLVCTPSDRTRLFAASDHSSEI
jgi:hypothetical protein